MQTSYQHSGQRYLTMCPLRCPSHSKTTLCTGKQHEGKKGSSRAAAGRGSEVHLHQLSFRTFGLHAGSQVHGSMHLAPPTIGEALTRTRSHSLALAHSHSDSLALTRTHSHSLTRTRSHSLAHTHSLSLTQSLTRIITRSQSLSLAVTHIALTYHHHLVLLPCTLPALPMIQSQSVPSPYNH